jgi:subtilisin family serine protease
MAVAAATALVGLSAGPAAAAPTNDPLSAEQWGLTDIKAPEAWPKGAGAGIKVAIVSSGIAKHQDLTAKLDAGFDVGGGDPTKDSDGRGTHLAGIVGAATNNSEGIAGVAPDARLLPYKAFENDKAIDTTKFLETMASAAAVKPQVMLVDAPSGFPSDGRDQLRNALTAVAQQGISVVIGAQSGLALADLPVLAVAATTQSGDQESGTAAVAGPGVAAPGRAITSTTVTASLLGETTFGYGPMSGTAAAAAHVAGAVAIVRSAGANPGQAADLLRSTARKASDSSLGAGIIDAAAAVNAYKKPAPPPPSTTTTKKAAAPVTTSKATGTAAIPKTQPSLVGPTATLPTGEPAEPGEGEPAVVPPGAEELFGDAGDGGQRVTIVTEGEERPMGTLAIGFGLLFGVGTGLSVTFRRLADAAA